MKTGVAAKRVTRKEADKEITGGDLFLFHQCLKGGVQEDLFVIHRKADKTLPFVERRFSNGREAFSKSERTR